jgi:N-acyl-L-homoserine lactone synthetase
MSRTAATGVVELDRLSERLLAAAAPLRVALAATDAEREAAYRLRYEQVVAHSWAPRGTLAPGAESDAHDADALHVLAWHDGAAAGTLRLVLPAPGRRLPVEAAFELDVEPRGAVVEAGRLVVAPRFRGDPAHRIWGALFARGWLSLRERGFSVLAGAASPRMVARLRALGLPFEILAPARPHWGEDRHPVRLDPGDSRPRWY